jgi:two-component system, NtrC family, sensor kinase
VTIARQGGLRLEIVLALGGLMVLAFVPLFFAVASLSRSTVWSLGEQSANALGRSMAAQVAEARESGRPEGVKRALEAQVRELGRDGVLAACVFRGEGGRVACAGAPAEASAIEEEDREHVNDLPRGSRAGEGLRELGAVVELACRAGDARLVVRMRGYDATTRATPLVRLVALYMTTFALALIVFAYFALTRLIVRPIDELVHAADRVASGARSLRVPRSGPRELEELATSMQAMAERLIAEEATLQLKVEELTETATRLTQAQAQLVRSERLASVGRLAAGLAHEIGNPIAALTGMQDLLLDGDLPADTQRDFLQRMRRETERIHGVLRDLLEFARPEEARRADGATAASADVCAVLDDVLALLKPQKAFRTVRVAADAKDAPFVALAAQQLTQVLLNVVLNAGAAVAATNRDGVVVVRARAVGERVRIEVEDNGPGVAPEVQETLFEPFVTTKPTNEGTGLGLAVCRGLVEAAGGTIAFDSSFEGGARFVIELPAARV